MRFVILSIEIKSAYIPLKGDLVFHGFKFGQVNCPGDLDTTTEVILEHDDPRVKEWYDAFIEQKFFEFSMTILE